MYSGPRSLPVVSRFVGFHRGTFARPLWSVAGTQSVCTALVAPVPSTARRGGGKRGSALNADEYFWLVVRSVVEMLAYGRPYSAS